MNQLPPNPNAMLPRKPNYTPRSPLPPTRRYAVDPALPRRHRPVTTALADTGFLYALARRPQYLKMFLALYGDTVAVADAVAWEIRKVAGYPLAYRRDRDIVVMGSCADRLVLMLDQGIIRVLDEPDEALDEQVTAVSQQLLDYERAQAEKHGKTLERVDASRTTRHDGEAESIVVAREIIKGGGRSILLTNDGGASRIAWERGVSCRHLSNILGELACADPELKAEDLLQAFAEMTADFGTPPADACPADASAYTCRSFAGACNACDPLDP